nr:helix-turn-helix domain-containing protein [Rhodococcus sp. USK10]
MHHRRHARNRGTTRRVSLQMVAALCDIFGCGVDDLVTVTATDTRRKRAAASTPNVVEMNKAAPPPPSPRTNGSPGCANC